jgi:hypothetical protein
MPFQKGGSMVLYCQCGARINRLCKVIRRLRRRLARLTVQLYDRKGRTRREEPEERRRKVRLREYELKRAADQGYQTFVRLAEGRRKKDWRLEEEAA